MSERLCNWLLSVIVSGWLGLACAHQQEIKYVSQWHKLYDGHYIGNELWANPMQDWKIQQGNLLCSVSGGERNVFLLTRQISKIGKHFQTRVKLKPSLEFLSSPTKGYVGFRIGVKGQYNDFRDSAIRGRGLKAGITSEGELFIGNTEGSKLVLNEHTIQLVLKATLNKTRQWDLTLLAFDKNNRELGTVSRKNISNEIIQGGLGLSCHAGQFHTREPWSDHQKNKINTTRFGNILFSFDEWTVSGQALSVHPERAYGPIAFSMFTVNSNLLKMTAQLFPVPLNAGDTAYLELKQPNDKQWRVVSASKIDRTSRTARFEIPQWKYETQIPFRIYYPMQNKLGNTQKYYYSGSINPEPIRHNRLRLASLSCQLDLGFPHQNMVKYIAGHKPDMMLFTGDQYYESNAGYGVQRAPLDKAYLDYLRKWYQFGWAFRDLFKNIPSVFLLDDHDVYHGNIWGEAGKKAEGKAGADIQDSGGFKMPASWVNAVQRSMTGHLPSAYDAAPVKQGISVYYTDLQYAGVSFAIVEDRKWKSAPRQLLPKAKIVNGFSRNLKWDAKKQGDVEGAVLLGQRQLAFLEQWSQDWSDDTRMKAVVSQTLFSSVQTRPNSDIIGFIDRGMRPVLPGEYPSDDVVVQDFDTNGWPQTPRKNAIKTIRKSFAYHIAGDTHLGVTFQYGVDGWGNAAWAIGSPAISNIWPRRWFPGRLPENYKQGSPRNLGDFKDGFGNPISVRAVANPMRVSVKPIEINERAPGYNILVFDTKTQTLTVEAWPRWVDPLMQSGAQFNGWPIEINQFENGFPHNGPILRKIEANSSDGAVLQVIDESSDEIIYTVRFVAKQIQARVFQSGIYKIRIYDHDMNLMKEFSKIKAE